MECGENDVYTGVAFILVSVVGVVGNLITLLILRKDDGFRAMNNARLPIGNLAAVDLLLSIRAVLYGIGIIDSKITAETTFCKVTAHITTATVPLTFLSHVLVAVHRWKTIKSFGSHHKDGPGFFSRWYSIAATWVINLIFSSVLNIPKVMGPITFQAHRGTCGGSGSLLSTIMSFFTIICIVIVFTSYFQIYRLVRSRNRQIRDQMETTDLNERVLKKRALKITKMTFIIFATLMASNIPYTVVVNLRNVSVIWKRITFLVLVTNYANNFFLYGLMDPEFRAKVKDLFKCK